MKYNVKWIEDNLGITRKTLIMYEAKRLMSSSRNPSNNYREYEMEDIDRIWGIRILQGIGYTLAEIGEFMDNPQIDFYESITKKVEELEKKKDEISDFINFAKTIKASGRIPTVRKVGSMRYADFMKYSRENWNFYLEKNFETSVDALETLEKIENKELSDSDIEKLEALFQMMENQQEMYVLYTVSAYYKILVKMRHLDYRDETVQIIINQIYDTLSAQDEIKQIENKNGSTYTKQIFAKYTVAYFMECSDIGKMNIKNYGKEGANFISNAAMYFGGYTSIEELLSDQ